MSRKILHSLPQPSSCLRFGAEACHALVWQSYVRRAPMVSRSEVCDQNTAEAPHLVQYLHIHAKGSTRGILRGERFSVACSHAKGSTRGISLTELC